MKNKRYLLIVLLAFAFFVFCMAFAGCDNNKPLSILLDESGKHSSEFVTGAAACYNGMLIDDENSEYLFAFDQECFDALLTDGNTQPRTTDIDTDVNIIETDVATVVASLKADEPTYKGAIISIQAPVASYANDGSSLNLSTPDGTGWIIRLFVRSFNFDISSVFPRDGTPKDFVLYVSSFEKNTVFCRAANPVNIASGRSFAHGTIGTTISTTVSEVIESMVRGESFFIFKRIQITAEVMEFNASENQDGLPYEIVELTKWESDILDEKANHTFRIHPTSQLWKTEFDTDYVVGRTYDFELIVHYLSGTGFFSEQDITVTTYLAN